MLEVTATQGGVIFTKDGLPSPGFRVYDFEVVSVTACNENGVQFTELGVMLPGYSRDRGAWLMSDAAESVTEPGRYTFAADLDDLTMEFRAVRDSQGRWHRVHNANPGVIPTLREWPVDCW